MDDTRDKNRLLSEDGNESEAEPSTDRTEPDPEATTPPPDDEDSSLLLLDDLLLSDGEESPAQTPTDEAGEESTLFSFEDDVTGGRPASGDPPTRAWEDPVVTEDSDLASLLLVEEDSGAPEPPADTVEPDATTGPPSEPSVEPPPVSEEEDDPLSGLLLAEVEEASAATGEPVADEPPPADDFDLKIVPIDEEELPDITEKREPELPAVEDDSAFSLLLGDDEIAPADSEEKAGDKAPPSGDSKERTTSIHELDTADLSDEPRRAPTHIEERDASSLLLGKEEGGDASPGAADLESAADTAGPATETPDDRSAMLADFATAPEYGTEAADERSSLLSDTDEGPAADVADGQSSLLMDSDYETSTAARTEEPVRDKRKRRRAKRERMRIVVPKPDKKIEWFSNPSACASYCRKHKRPLMIYFTTGDAEQCQTYEEAVRMAELQPFLVPYVCCLADLRQDDVGRVAERLGLPAAGPSVIVLSPSGREFARIVKPVVDWQFLATMLFWALR